MAGVACAHPLNTKDGNKPAACPPPSHKPFTGNKTESLLQNCNNSPINRTVIGLSRSLQIQLAFGRTPNSQMGKDSRERQPGSIKRRPRPPTNRRVVITTH